jgi:hypothetical protein
MPLLSDSFIHSIQAEFAAIWVSNADADGQPDLVRLTGVRMEPDRQHLTLFLPLRTGQGILHNLAGTHQLSFLFALLHTNASYQLKGTYVSHWPCTDEEVAFQRDFLHRMGPVLEKQGLSPEQVFRAYFHQPSAALRMRVEEIYEQTPRQGTGQRIHVA